MLKQFTPSINEMSQRLKNVKNVTDARDVVPIASGYIKNVFQMEWNWLYSLQLNLHTMWNVHYTLLLGAHSTYATWVCFHDHVKILRFQHIMLIVYVLVFVATFLGW